MPNWNDINDEIKQSEVALDIVRRKYIKALHKFASRNVIIYYSGWLQFKNQIESLINDDDKNGFMTTIQGLDRSKGLDLILHTPGGDLAATESIIDYLLRMFHQDIRAIVPQLAMSGGTMMCLACKSIVMGKQSSLCPIDPQLDGIPTHGVIEEFNRAYKECKSDPDKIPVWQPILNNSKPTLIGKCQKVITWSEDLAGTYLSNKMLRGDKKKDQKDKIASILKVLTDHSFTLSHTRHLNIDICEQLLKIERMEDNQDFQDAILSVHHACMHTIAQTGTIKLIENQDGKAYIKLMRN